MGKVYTLASGILRVRAAGFSDAVLLNTELLGAARELLVPLTEGADWVLQFAALEGPGAGEAAELPDTQGRGRERLFVRCVVFGCGVIFNRHKAPARPPHAGTFRMLRISSSVTPRSVQLLGCGVLRGERLLSA